MSEIDSAGGQHNDSSASCPAVDSAINNLRALWLPTVTDLEEVHRLLTTARPSIVTSTSGHTVSEDLEDAFDQAIAKLQDYGRFLMLVEHLKVSDSSEAGRIVDDESDRRERAMTALTELRDKLT